MGFMTMNAALAPVPVADPGADMNRAATQLAAYALADHTAELLNLPLDLVWDVLLRVPDNMLTLLDSPQGWTALSGFVAAELGVCASNCMPALH